MTFGAEVWGPPLIQAAGSVAGGYLSGQGGGETKQQRMNRNVAKDLINSIKGQGSYSHLFNTSEADFQKGFVQPALSRFKNQISPQIQQQFAASGQHLGSGLNDALTRAGVDLNQMINENFLQYQQGGQNRALQALGLATGQGAGAPNQLTTGESLANATGGYLSSDAFSNSVSKLFKNQDGGVAQNTIQGQPQGYGVGTPKGFAQDYKQWSNAGVGNPGWGG